MGSDCGRLPKLLERLSAIYLEKAPNLTLSLRRIKVKIIEMGKNLKNVQQSQAILDQDEGIIRGIQVSISRENNLAAYTTDHLNQFHCTKIQRRKEK